MQIRRFLQWLVLATVALSLPLVQYSISASLEENKFVFDVSGIGPRDAMGFALMGSVGVLLMAAVGRWFNRYRGESPFNPWVTTPLVFVVSLLYILAEVPIFYLVVGDGLPWLWIQYADFFRFAPGYTLISFLFCGGIIVVLGEALARRLVGPRSRNGSVRRRPWVEPTLDELGRT